MLEPFHGNAFAVIFVMMCDQDRVGRLQFLRQSVDWVRLPTEFDLLWVSGEMGC